MHVHLALELEVELRDLAGLEVPDRRSRVSFTLVLEGEPLVAGDRGPAPGMKRQSFVDLLSDGRACPRVEHSERRVDQVAVLGVLDAEEAAVCRQAATLEPPRRPELHGLARMVDPARRSAVQ